ncbi:1-aminocyclopropane-1-carboxylate deaminase/D-cysteine desulfhydrase [Taibaiella soli]|nr:pyridoxal-phosphate dependent enzyme [Taibaiella soli]
MDIISEATLAAKNLPVQSLKSWTGASVIRVDMLRLDLFDPVISGNKWYKLIYNLQAAKEQGFTTILTFGGPFSNHLVAAAAAAKKYGFRAIGIVRGMEPQSTVTLKDCIAYGMQLHGVTREEYKLKNDSDYLSAVSKQFNQPFIIPEGGANEAGRKGSALIAEMISDEYTNICLSAGTGTTLAGIRSILPVHQHVIGFAPMKGGHYLEEEIKPFLSEEKHDTFHITDEWHFGGFGKITPALQSFMDSFFSETDIQLDRVYTGKMMFGLQEMIARGEFDRDAKILCIHTGGVQGNVTMR